MSPDPGSAFFAEVRVKGIIETAFGASCCHWIPFNWMGKEYQATELESTRLPQSVV